MRPPSKSSSQRHHAKRRAEERFGLAPSDVKRIGQMIRAGKTSPLWRKSNRVTIHRVSLDDVVVNAVYDSKRKRVVTLLLPSRRQSDGRSAEVNEYSP